MRLPDRTHKAWKDWKFTAAMVLLGLVIGVALWFVPKVEKGVVVAVAFGMPTFIYAVKQFRDARATIDELGRLEQELSTRLLGDAPRFLPELVRLIEEAKEGGEIIIFCDFPAYTAATRPDHCAKYLDAIKTTRKKGIKVKLMFLDEDNRRKLAREFYESDQRSELPDPSQFPTTDDFLTFINTANFAALGDAFRDAEPFPITRVMPLHFWIVDGERAIFSFQRYKERVPEIGFKTRDSSLVTSLRRIFDHYV